MSIGLSIVISIGLGVLAGIAGCILVSELRTWRRPPHDNFVTEHEPSGTRVTCLVCGWSELHALDEDAARASGAHETAAVLGRPDLHTQPTHTDRSTTHEYAPETP